MGPIRYSTRKCAALCYSRDKQKRRGKMYWQSTLICEGQLKMELERVLNDAPRWERSDGREGSPVLCQVRLLK